MPFEGSTPMTFLNEPEAAKSVVICLEEGTCQDASK